MIQSDLEALSKQLSTDYFSSKKCLITGGAGFVGSWLSNYLVSAQAIAHCVDNLSTGVSSNFECLVAHANFKFLRFDVTESGLQNAGYGLVFHFASHASPEEYQEHPIETLMANAQGTQNMLEIARKSDAVLVYASSSEVYGHPMVVPTPETYWGNVNPVGVRSCYDEGKRFGEAMCMAYHRTYGLDVRIIRIFNTYGPRLRSDGLYARALSRFIEQALAGNDITVYGRGDQTRSFCYITDTLGAVLSTSIRKEMKGEVVNIGNPEEVSILNLAENIRAITKTESEIKFRPRPPDDPDRRCPDISKATKILGWHPKIALKEGLQKTVEWFMERRTRNGNGK